MSQRQEGKLIEASVCGPGAGLTVVKFSLEVQVLEGEVRLHDACGLDPGPQDVLLSGDVGGLGYPVQIVQVAGGGGERGEVREGGGSTVGENVSEVSRSGVLTARTNRYWSILSDKLGHI